MKSATILPVLLQTVILLIPSEAIDAAEPVQPMVAPRAKEFPLSAVTLLDGPFKHAMEIDRAYLLRLDPDRFLAGFRREAGLPKKAEPYGGWEPFYLVACPKTSLQGGSATASLELAADGTPTTLWSSSEAGKQWLEFDFGEVYEISRYVIRHAGADGMSRDLNTRSFILQARAHGESWKTIDVVKRNTGNVTDVELVPVAARSIKITVTNPGVDSTARISEVEIFGKTPSLSRRGAGLK